VDLPEGSSLTNLVSHLIDWRLEIAPDRSLDEAGWQVLVNWEFERDMERILQEGDQASIVPPLAGG
jgi:molybdopterin converting factor small subunit